MSLSTTLSQRTLRLWLSASAFLVFSMVVVGGLTRLTRSGLSIVEWKPITGILPPLSEEKWQEEFTKYQQYPEFKKINHQMELDEFKDIYAWEYAHRLLGRLVGLVFAIPLLVYALRRQLSRPLLVRLAGILFLGACQGFLGWYMVKSGLVDKPSVSHLRLAAHLLLALLVFSLLSWTIFGLKVRPSSILYSYPRSWLARLCPLFLGLVVLQIFYGALTAGLHAGKLYNSFPLMNGLWVPPGLWQESGLYSLISEPVTTQFIHRILAWSLLLSSAGLGWMAWHDPTLSRSQRRSVLALPLVLSLQFFLGVATLLMHVPVALGSMHQIGACLVLLAALRAVYELRAQPQSADLTLQKHTSGAKELAL